MIRRIARSFAIVLISLSAFHAVEANVRVPDDVSRLADGQVRADVQVLAMGQFPDSEQTIPANGVTVRACTVTSVHDGDSMRVRCPGFKKTLPIRLDQIDAPELDQAYGITSRDYLRAICPVGSDVTVHDSGPDKYKRRLGRVFCEGTEPGNMKIDANAAMIESGSAWVYDYYMTDKSLYRLQNDAKTEKRGLWANPKPPVKPWDFRKQNRKK